MIRPARQSASRPVPGCEILQGLTGSHRPWPCPAMTSLQVIYFIPLTKHSPGRRFAELIANRRFTDGHPLLHDSCPGGGQALVPQLGAPADPIGPGPPSVPTSRAAHGEEEDANGQEGHRGRRCESAENPRHCGKLGGVYRAGDAGVRGPPDLRSRSRLPRKGAKTGAE